jgi:hypothetical protein
MNLPCCLAWCFAVPKAYQGRELAGNSSIEIMPDDGIGAFVRRIQIYVS